MQALCQLGVFFALHLKSLTLFLKVGRVVALVGVGAAAVELENPLGDIVKKVAIVGYCQNGARVLRQVLLEPQHALGVKVVCGLIEQQQVGLLQQQLAERDASALTAREVSYRSIRGRAAQRIHGLFELTVKIPGVKAVDFFLQHAHFGQQCVVVSVGIR